MSRLRICPSDQPGTVVLDTEDRAEIVRRLQSAGVEFTRWESKGPLGGVRPPSADEVLAAYGKELQAIRARGYGTIDVVSVDPDADDPTWPERARRLRETFRAEHTHAESEIRFFASGRGAFYLRPTLETVHLVLCEAGDLISVPAGTRHWFDMGESPRFCAIRFFTNPQGWVGQFTGDSIAQHFLTLDTWVAT